ncbi:SDR family NAD(P)-dependent oxidoreductase [Oricola cellulosilytica]|uniref:SDR family oxidoreductase n=1 Tax=Oricola cellulosilytica TaxID=1429082 RepID=A0A4R0P5D5_9HYPH|nr:SDR family NAD(P)-dependent oxidoreductase [Oricola cellulosilytica]TCD11867.1 SDR family oxidoreductase [Oricola cellulosilytica]
MQLQDKHAIVTGGGSGVGAAIATLFAEAGARVTVMGRREEPLRALAAQERISWQVCDVTDSEAVVSAFDAARAQNGTLDIVIANAGEAVSKPFVKMVSSDLDAALSVNLVGTFNCFKAALADMSTAGWGRLIAIASIAGLKGYPYVSGYCAAKHGVVGLTRGLAVELGKSGITVNAICPGFIETPMLERSIANIVSKTGKSQEEASNLLKSGNPQGRFIQPVEVAEAALWLCSEGARSVNGHALSVSGGEI